jgi:hypothetical protein
VEGDEVTLVDMQLRLVPAYFRYIDPRGPYAMVTLTIPHHNGLIARPLAREGVTWIRGQHDETSPEGRALLATYMLVMTP